MLRAIFYNLNEHFSIAEILDSKTFEPFFLNWNEEILSDISEYHLIVYYSPKIDLEIIKKIRHSLNFKNIRVLIYCDQLNLGEKKEAIVAGADIVNLLPENTDDLVPSLKKIQSAFDNSSQFEENGLLPFQAAITEIFSTMAMINVNLVQTYLSDGKFHFGNITAIMALAGNEKGIVLVSLHESFARSLVSNMMGVTPDMLEEEELHDGIGELINMIAGGAKARLGDTEEHFLLSAPSVITGTRHRIIQSKDMPCVTMVYEAEEQYFAVKICLMNLEKK